MFAQLLPVLAPVFAVIGLGWGWVRSGRGYDTRMVTELVTLVGAPALAFSTLAELDIDAARLGAFGLAVVLGLGLAGAGGALLLLIGRQPVRAFLPPMTFGNIGNMGLPLCLFAFGDRGLGLGIVVYAITSVSMFTIGVTLYAGHGMSRVLLRNPLLYAVAAALPFLFDWLALPRWLGNAAELLGSFTIPLMLFTLGVSLARLRVRQLPRTAMLSLARLVLGLAAGITAAWVFELEGVARSVLILQSAMPVAVFNYLFAERYQRYPEETAGLVVLSTVFSLATLPLLLGWLMSA